MTAPVGKYMASMAFGALTAAHLNAQNADYVTIFAHGLSGNANERQFYQDLFACPIVGQQGPEGRNIFKSCLGQEADINVVLKQIDEQNEKNIILLGVSKGAATMINTLGLLAYATTTASTSVNPDIGPVEAKRIPAKLPQIKAVILEAPFITPEHVAQSLLSKYTGIDTKKPSVYSFIKAMEPKVFPYYNPLGITPLFSIKNLWKSLDHELVVIILHSLNDTIVPLDNSRFLYQEIKKMGFTNAYLIEVPEGIHGNMCWGPCKDRIRDSLCFIFAHHGLPVPSNYKKPADLTRELFQPAISPDLACQVVAPHEDCLHQD